MIHRFDSIKKDFVKSTTIFIYQLFVNLFQGVLKNTSFYLWRRNNSNEICQSKGVHIKHILTLMSSYQRKSGKTSAKQVMRNLLKGS